MLQKPNFIMLIGLPASGKDSFYYEYLSNNYLHLSSDDLRLKILGDEEDQTQNAKIFDLMKKHTIQSLKNKVNVCYNATNLNQKKRVGLLKDLPDCKKIAIVMATPYSICLERNSRRERVVPENVIERMYKSFQPPYFCEGFDEIYIYNSKEKEDLWSIMKENILCEHDNPHHSYSCGNHCLAAERYIRENIFFKVDSFLKETLETAARFHDLSKYKCKVWYNKKGEKSDKAHYYSHENVGAYDFLCGGLEENYKNENLLIANLISNHMVFYAGDGAINKRRKLYGEDFWEFLSLIHEADQAAH